MYDLSLHQCMMKSWQRCMKQGLPMEIEKPRICLTSKELNNKLKKKNDAILSFNNFIDRHLDLIRKIKGCYYFALFDNEENLLAIRIGPNNNDRYVNSFFITGASYCEKSVGTNAVSLSKLLKRPVYMHPDFHYCNRLKNWYEYCVPIKFAGNVNGYISVISVSLPISKAMEGFIDLLRINMYEELPALETDNNLYGSLKERLTEKQYIILKMMAQGLTDTHISRELKMSLSTVKYHNQNIFKVLNANSRVDAVVKALTNNDLNIIDICCDRP